MRRRKSPKPALPTLVALVGFSMPYLPAQSGRPPAIPFTPLATGIPITVTYRVQRSETPNPAPRAYNAPTAKMISWTPSGSRSAADLGTWTYERDIRGNWTSEFGQSRTGLGVSSPEWRYRARSAGAGIEIETMQDPADFGSSYGPPPEFVAGLLHCALPFAFEVPATGGAAAQGDPLESFLSSLDAADAERTERGWQITAAVNHGMAMLSIEADEEGRLLRIEQSSTRLRHDGPVSREVIDVEEVRVVDGAQMPWSFTRTVYEGARVWDRLEYQVLEAVPVGAGKAHASLY